MSLVDHLTIGDAESRRLPEKVTQPSMTGVLAWALRLSRGGAGRRLRAARAVGQRVAMTGEHLTPVRPALASVQRDGLAGPEGEPTDLANLTLLCAYHHHDFASRGWTCQMTDRLPTWTPPR